MGSMATAALPLAALERKVSSSMALKGLVFYCNELPAQQRLEATSVIRTHGGDIAYLFDKERVSHVLLPPSTPIESRPSLKGARAVITPDKLRELTGEPIEAPQPPSAIRNGALSRAATAPVRKTSDTVLATAPPVISRIVPAKVDLDNGPVELTVFGVNFRPSAAFRITFDGTDATSIEFHGTTALLCVVSLAKGTHDSEIMVAASSDGVDFGLPFALPVHGRAPTSPSLSTELTVLLSQLHNVRRAISVIQASEELITRQLGMLLPPDALDRLPLPAPATTVPAPAATAPSAARPLSPRAASAPVAAAPPRRAAEVAPGRLLEREVRVFVSSPFRDMQQERDLLVKKVFPKLRKLCMARDVMFSYVDLRWGVTSAQADQGVAMLLCLREAARSNVFVGCLGERYGPSLNIGTAEELEAGRTPLHASFKRAMDEFPWVADYRDRSMTEVEMRMVLGSHAPMPGRAAFFFLRDPYFVQEVPADQRDDYQSEGPEAHAKLDALKRDLKASGLPSRDYKRPASLGDAVLQAVSRHIDQQFPEASAAAPLERERFRHMVVSKSLCRVYLPNNEYFESLDRFVQSPTLTPFVVVADAGMGKSALLANWRARHDEHHPEDIVIMHHVSCSAASASAEALVQRVLDELALQLERRCHSKPASLAPAPAAAVAAVQQSRADAMIAALTRLLARFSERPRVILLLDGLDRLDNRGGALELVWLPHFFPAQVRVIVSCKGGEALEVLKKRECQLLHLQALSQAERKSMLRLHFKLGGKQLSEKCETQIASASHAANPRYLQTLCEDLALFHRHEELDEHVRRMLECASTSQLLASVLRRFAKDYDPQHKGIVQHVAGFYWAARRGLAPETELARLLEAEKIDVKDVEDFMVVFEQLLTPHGELLAIADDDLRMAIEAAFLTSDGLKTFYHTRLAAYFAALPDLTDRKLDELPYHYCATRDAKGLARFLANWGVFDALFSELTQFDLLRYWRTAEEASDGEVSATRAFSELVAQSDFPPGVVRGDIIMRVAAFLGELGHEDGAEVMFGHARTYFVSTRQVVRVLELDVQLAGLLHAKGRFERAEELLVEAVARLRQLEQESASSGDAKRTPFTARLLQTIEQLGQALMAQKKTQAALELLQPALQRAQTVLGAKHPVTADLHYCLGCTYLIESSHDSRKLAMGEAELLHALSSLEAALGLWHPSVARVLNRMGSLYIEQDQYADAETCLQRALTIRETKLGTFHSRTMQSLKHLMSLYEILERYATAEEYGKRALEIAAKLMGKRSMQAVNIVVRLATVRMLLKDKAGCIKLLKKALRTCEKQGYTQLYESIYAHLAELDAPPQRATPTASPKPLPQPAMRAAHQQGAFTPAAPPPPPPPPPPGATAAFFVPLVAQQMAPPPPVMQQQQQQQMMPQAQFAQQQLLSNMSGRAVPPPAPPLPSVGGVPPSAPPPPPPSSGGKAADKEPPEAPAFAQASNFVQVARNDVQALEQVVLRKKGAVMKNRSDDAGQAARQMLARNDRKINLRRLSNAEMYDNAV